MFSVLPQSLFSGRGKRPGRSRCVDGSTSDGGGVGVGVGVGSVSVVNVIREAFYVFNGFLVRNGVPVVC